MMDLIVLGAIVIAVTLFILMRVSKSSNPKPAYSLRKFLLSKAERSFYGVLMQAVAGTGVVFTKVRVADVISPRKGMNRSDWQKAFNAVSAKHFDFILCDPKDCCVLLAIELDDSSHESTKAVKRDSLVNAACDSAGLPLLRVKAAHSYAIADIQRAISNLTPLGQIAKFNEYDAHPSSISAGTDKQDDLTLTHQSLGSGSSTPAQEPPTCPKCSATMSIRTARSGINKGQAFWGCSTFPKCRATIPLDGISQDSITPS